MATPNYRKPRLVTIWKKGRPSFGFNLHGLKGKPGQTVKSVDENGPAYEAGVFAGDRILGVGDDSVVGETHTMVVERIRREKESVTILLIDEESLDYCNARGIAIQRDNALILSNEHGPVIRAEIEPITARRDQAGEGAPTKAQGEKAVAPSEAAVGGGGGGGKGGGKALHVFSKRKVSKRDEAKNAKSDWAARMAAFDNL